MSMTPTESARADTLDKSEFHRFEFVQQPALGFCPNPDAPTRATIVKQDDGSYLYKASVVEGDGSIQEFSASEQGFFFEASLNISTRSLALRVLSDAEVERVREVFSSVSITSDTISENDMIDMFGQSIMCSDPCRIISVQWDDARFDDGLFGCIEAGRSYSVVSGDELNEIIQLLAELDQASCAFDPCGVCLIPASLGVIAALSGTRLRRRRSG